MVGLVKKFLPFTRNQGGAGGSGDEDDPNNPEYSFALVYSGPVTSDVPRVVPIDIRSIPVASVVSSVSSLSDVSLPVVQPIVKSSRAKNEQANGSGVGGDAVCESSGRVGDVTQLGSAGGNGCLPEMSIGTCCEGRRSPSEQGGSLEGSELGSDGREDGGDGFQGYMNPANFDSIESSASSRSNSSEIFSGREEDGAAEAPTHSRRPSVVTFQDPESGDGSEGDSEQLESGNHVLDKRVAVRPGKKGTCYRCMKGNKLTDKEVCIVCGAKFCSDCVLRAMGTMPEGRKCITCIGHRIDEARRDSLGKSSWMLKRILPEVEVKRIMEVERTCEVNQLPPECVFVNHQCLSQQELILLQTCQHPPKHLKPGSYWYDKVSGFWGKEGHKPCQIISPQLIVGGHLQRDASNGNTEILINNREITKAELIMLQVAGVKCEGATSFWVSADGSYQEEGMNNIKGKIWKTSKARMTCYVLSLPVPPDSISSPGDEANTSIPKRSQDKSLYKLLLVGSEKSGTNTIFKQAKIVYNVPFSEEDRRSIKSIIQSNLYRYLAILLEACEQFEEEILIEKRRNLNHLNDDSGDDPVPVDNATIYSIDPRLRNFSDWLLQVMAAGNLESIFPAATRVYAPSVETLWKDAAFQATYERRKEINLLPRVATYFLDRAVEIARTDYEPSDIDILYAEGITPSKGLSSMEFSYSRLDSDSCEPILYEHNPSSRYQLIRVHPRVLGGNYKWSEMFEDVDVILFCVSLTEYAEFSKDCTGVPVNKMMASKQLFESIVTHPTFEDKKFLLILNKYDMLEEKIQEAPLTRCEWFCDFSPVVGQNTNNNRSRMTNPPLAHRAFQYIAVKFKRLYQELTDRKLYVSLVTGLEPDNVDQALRYAREILKWKDEEPSYQNQEQSSASMDASSSS